MSTEVVYGMCANLILSVSSAFTRVTVRLSLPAVPYGYALQ